MAQAILALGANLGDPERQIAQAIAALGENPAIEVLGQSTIIISAPWGKTDQGEFHNGAILIETSLTPLELLDFCLATENAIGRVRTEKWGPRTIDIDIIVYDRMVLDSVRLTLPHPYAHERDFVLDPVREIAPEMADWLMIQGAKKSG